MKKKKNRGIRSDASEGPHKTVKARTWPWLSDRSPGEGLKSFLRGKDLKHFSGLLHESQGQVLALTVLYVPHLLDCLMCAIFRGNDLKPFSGLLSDSQGQVLVLHVLCVPCLRTNARI